MIQVLDMKRSKRKTNSMITIRIFPLHCWIRNILENPWGCDNIIFLIRMTNQHFHKLDRNKSNILVEICVLEGSGGGNNGLLRKKISTPGQYTRNIWWQRTLTNTSPRAYPTLLHRASQSDRDTKSTKTILTRIGRPPPPVFDQWSKSGLLSTNLLLLQGRGITGEKYDFEVQTFGGICTHGGGLPERFVVAYIRSRHHRGCWPRRIISPIMRLKFMPLTFLLVYIPCRTRHLQPLPTQGVHTFLDTDQT